jgi:predicted dehydrogenase
LKKVGIIGCGYICEAYFNAARRYPSFEIVACSDLDSEKAQTVARRFGVSAMRVEELLESNVDVILNLTTHAAHAPVTLDALRAGKHVYSEKPLALTMRDAAQIAALARDRGLRVGCGPDHFLGDGWQSVREVLDAGLIGAPLNAYMHMLHRGIEHWFLNPGYFYKPDGMMFDWFPYALTELVAVLGDVRNVTGHTFQSPQPRFDYRGNDLPVTAPTHVNAILEFRQGTVVTLVISADVQDTSLPPLEIRGTHGTLLGPHPFSTDTMVLYQRFDPRAVRFHTVYQKRFGAPRWKEQLGRFVKNPRNLYREPKRQRFGYNTRGCGLHDMVLSIEEHRPHRCSLELATHVLEVLLGILRSAETGQRGSLETHCERPPPLSQQP